MAESVFERRPVAGLRVLARAALLPCILIIALIAALAFGTVAISPVAIGQILLAKLGLQLGHVSWPAYDAQIIWDLRLPRVLGAALVGMSLAVAGALFQAILRNPLADPYVIGTSAGAQLGVTLTFLLPVQFVLFGFQPAQLFAFVGAVATVLFVYSIARTRNGTSVITLILSGFVVSSFLISATTFLTYTGARVSDRLSQVLTWTMGGVQVEHWSQLGVAAPGIVLGSMAAYILAAQLNLMLLGEDQASHLGVRVEMLKLIAIVLASLLTALAVTLAGVVAFVGLVVPHAVRLLYGPGHRVLVPAAAIGGAAFVVLCDLIARVVIAPSEVPLGVVTAIIGAPFFIHLLRRNRRSYAG
ncbi:MAG: FecCD family ABC transporter permease [Chloroflexota bacterium]